MRRILAILLVTTFVVATGAPAAHAGGHGAARVAIGLAGFVIFAPFIIVGEALAQIARSAAPAVVVAPPPVYYAPAPTYYAPPRAYSAPAPTYSAPPAPLVQREVVYPHGKYVLYGDGLRQSWQWVWVPAVPAFPPPPPSPQ